MKGCIVGASVVIASVLALSCGSSGGTGGTSEAGGPTVDAADALSSGIDGADLSEEPEGAVFDAADVADVTVFDAPNVEGSLAHDAPSEVGLPPIDAAAEGEAGPVDAAMDAEAALEDVTPDRGAQDAAGDLSTAPCLTGGNVLYVNGGSGSFWLTGAQTDSTGSTWAVSAQNYTAKYDGALVEVHLPGSQSSDPWWYIAFDTSNFSQAVQLGTVYTGAAPFSATAGAAGLTIGYAQTCGTGVGSFRIDQLVATGDASEDTLVELTAAFSATCEANSVPLRGCIHYGP